MYMPRLSLYKPQRGNDYAFIDKQVYEMFTVGGTDINIHKFLGAENPSEAVGRAKTLLGQTGYNPLTRNCEHYAQWACNGDWKSEQVAGAASIAKTGILTILGTAGIMFIIYDRLRTR